MNKEKYYVNLQSKEIAKMAYQNNTDFTIYATKEEVSFLRKKLDNVHKADTGTFWRSYVPIMPYHNDESNDNYDEALLGAFQMIYELGDDDAQQFIEDNDLLTKQSTTGQ